MSVDFSSLESVPSTGTKDNETSDTTIIVRQDGAGTSQGSINDFESEDAALIKKGGPGFRSNTISGAYTPKSVAATEIFRATGGQGSESSVPHWPEGEEVIKIQTWWRAQLAYRARTERENLLILSRFVLRRQSVRKVMTLSLRNAVGIVDVIPQAHFTVIRRRLSRFFLRIQTRLQHERCLNERARRLNRLYLGPLKTFQLDEGVDCLGARRPQSWSVFSGFADPNTTSPRSALAADWRIVQSEALDKWLCTSRKFTMRVVKTVQRWWKRVRSKMMFRGGFSRLVLERFEQRSRARLLREEYSEQVTLVLEELEKTEVIHRRRILYLRNEPESSITERLFVEAEESSVRQCLQLQTFTHSQTMMTQCLKSVIQSQERANRTLLQGEANKFFLVSKLRFVLLVLREMKSNLFLDSEQTIIGMLHDHEMVIDGEHQDYLTQGTQVARLHSTSGTEKLLCQERSQRLLIENRYSNCIAHFHSEEMHQRQVALWDSQLREKREFEENRDWRLSMNSRRPGGFVPPKLQPMFHGNVTRPNIARISEQGSSFMRTSLKLVMKHNDVTRIQKSQKDMAHFLRKQDDTGVRRPRRPLTSQTMAENSKSRLRKADTRSS